MNFARAFSTALAFSSPTIAGPPYLTDDPVPTETGHWEFYTFAAGEGHASLLDGEAGIDLNYGPAEGVQLTATFPLSISHEANGWRKGPGDIELGVKYRFINATRGGISIAMFPRTVLPTADREPHERARFLLPLWAEKDFAGGASLFGGGGYKFNRGPGRRDFWQSGVALTQAVSRRFSMGAELAWQGAESIGSTSQTRAGLGCTVMLSRHYALLVSGGPTWADGQTSYHFYAALGLAF